MKNIIKNHPIEIFKQDIHDICKPLHRLNISNFCHVNISNNAYSAVTNCPKFHIHYLENEYYNSDIYFAKQGALNRYFVWDFAKISGKSVEIYNSATEFGLRHTFTLIDTDTNDKNFYHFSTNQSDDSINQFYINNIDLLEQFISHFKQSMSSSKSLLKAYEIKYGMNTHKGKFDFFSQDHNLIQSRQSFYEDLNRQLPIYLLNSKSLTSQQTKILHYLHQGKTINDIATLMYIAEVTVNKHIANIKRKLGCHSQFQLGEIYSKILGNKHF